MIESHLEEEKMHASSYNLLRDCPSASLICIF